MTKLPYQAADKMSARVEQFDQCVAEMSPEGQELISNLVRYVSNELKQGGGEKSAKEIIWQALKFEEMVNTRPHLT